MESAVAQGSQDGCCDCKTPTQQASTLRKPIVRGVIILALVGAVAVISFYGGMSMANACAAKSQDAASSVSNFVAAPVTGLRTGKAATTGTASTPSMAMRAPDLENPIATEMEMENKEFLAPGKTTWTHCSRRNALMRAAAAAAAMAGVQPPAFAAATARVKMGSDTGELKFVPTELKVCKGDTVMWMNNKAGPHNVVFTKVPMGVKPDSVGMESGSILAEEGETFSATFVTPGKYSFVCEPHGTSSGMVGELTVAA